MAEKILIITPVAITPSYSGNRKRIQFICSELKKLGFELDLFYTGYDKVLNEGHQQLINGSILTYKIDQAKYKFLQNPSQRCFELLNGILIRFEKVKRFLFEGFESARYNKSIREYRNLSKLQLLRDQIKGHEYKAVIVNYAVFSFYFDLFSDDVIKIIDLHDCLTDRYKIFTERDEKPVNWYSLSYVDEKKAIKKADLVWAITLEEKKFYQNMLKESDVIIKTLRHITTFNRVEKLPEAKSKSVIMIGSDNALNIMGLKWFLEKIWPEVYSQHPDSELIIAGSICNSVEFTEKNQGVNFFGKYDNEKEVYGLADICINPMPSGTGLKIKTLEALSYGKRVLSTKAGATGLMDFENMGLFCSDNPEAWIEELHRLFSNNERNVEFLKALEKHIQEIYDQNLKVLQKSFH